MNYFFKGVHIFYEFLDKNCVETTIILHGWGCSSKNLKFAEGHLNQNLLFIDFPPFGESQKSVVGWTIFTYANMVMSLCEHLGVEKFNLLGHSFGGRVAILISALCKEKVQKLLLVASAGVKPRRKFKYYAKICGYKIKKRFCKNLTNCGSEDYRALDDDMKKVFCNIVNTHLDDFLSQIEAKTLIVFGKDDVVTPIYMAKTLHKKIRNSQLQILNGAGHFCFDDRRAKFVVLMKEFLNQGAS